MGASVVLLVASLASTDMAGWVSLYSGYNANKAAKQSAGMQTLSSIMAGKAQRAAGEAESKRLQQQAAISALQAKTEGEKAGMAQEQGEIEARRRSLQLSYDIGNTYAQWAGNGLLVDGGADTLGQLVKNNTQEAAQDIGIIETNTENAVWEHDVNRTMYKMTQCSQLSQAENAITIADANADATLMAGEAQAYATRQAGITAMYQGWIGRFNSWAQMAKGGGSFISK